MNRNSNDVVKSALSKFEFFDTLILIYIAVFVREYFWALQNNKLAWFVTAIGTAVIGGLYLFTKQPEKERISFVFWLIVGLSFLFVFSLRVVYPDLSFDVLNYHIFHSERALRGLLKVPGDFVPAYFPFLNNPAPDMITGIFRHVLGYRLGTAVNFIVLLWTGVILFRFLRSYFESVVLRSTAVLVILLSEELLFEINNYMIDLLAIPLLLQATVLAIRKDSDEASVKRFIVVMFFLGMSVALKLTNLVFAFPIGLVALYTFVSTRPATKTAFRALIAGAVAFIFPILPYTAYVYAITGNPTFPLFNKIFKSPLWPIENVFDGRWGPKGTMETLIWPFKIWQVPERVSELNVYGGRISMGVAAACFLIAFSPRDSQLRRLGLITILGAALWSAGTGYIRYGLILEVLGGLALVTLGMTLWNAESKPRVLRRVSAGIVFGALIVQTLAGAAYVGKTEWGGRSVSDGSRRGELKEMLSDRSLTQYLNSDQATLFRDVEAWIDSSYKTSAIAVMLKNNIPYVNTFVDAFFATPPAFKKYQSALQTVAHKKMVSLAFEEDLSVALATLDRRGFDAKKVTRMEFPYYSQNRRLHLAVIEVALKPSAQPEGIFDAQIELLQSLSIIKPGEVRTIRVKVTNRSAGVWSANGNPEGAHQVKLGNKWLDDAGNVVINDDGRTSLPRDIKPGDEVELELSVKGPQNPGSYVLMLDLVQENVAWFNEKGSTTANLKVKVER
jgi:hypothetical protein